MIYFSDVFEVEQSKLEDCGAFNIALVNDLPLFVDPFLLFDSEQPEIRALHEEIIKYLVFVRDRAQADELTEGAISQWLFFREVKQNWLGSAAREQVPASGNTSPKRWPGTSSACSVISGKSS